MNASILAALVCAIVAVAALAWAFLERRRAGEAEARAWDLAERANGAEARVRMLEEQASIQAELVKAQAAQSAGAVAEALLKQTEETFKNRELLAQKRIEDQLKPVAETLQKFQEQVTAAEKARAEETGGLKEQINQLLQASTATQEEARKLSSALRRGAGVQGRWGEQTLRNVLEAAGLAHRFDFSEQTSTDSEEGRRRPDVTIRLPGGGVFVIDAKCSLNAFLELQEALDEAGRDACGVRHVQSVRGHIQGLSAKAYWDQFDSSPDFVAMFVPLDSALAAALDRAPDLMTEAMERRVVIVTPTTLFALCKAVAYGWRVEEQAVNARKIADLGRELHKRIAVMGTHASSVGKALTAAVDRYNQFVGSLETQVLTQAKRFEDLKVDHEGRQVPSLDPVESAVRPLTKLSVAEAPRARLVAGEEAS
ncbi:DNA recombination protein RmuC [Phenylobacterium deserti]|uniref:DNA recombination protein RmuC homolog n=1 Tax=Phenylobacterium deserti TaxID=1914756 RepID=A0A328AS66_9CAUL|nr:DNA recombination protein RmuC [Phenylobacterium deserti]RAK57800.1 DNA recombination protein RmuC [Phenylobacterium deserti]